MNSKWFQKMFLILFAKTMSLRFLVQKTNQIRQFLTRVSQNNHYLFQEHVILILY
ncbi:hypothetical protein Bpfe_006615, partial [Biomphalaria pfeifferi]